MDAVSQVALLEDNSMHVRYVHIPRWRNQIHLIKHEYWYSESDYYLRSFHNYKIIDQNLFLLKANYFLLYMNLWLGIHLYFIQRRHWILIENSKVPNPWSNTIQRARFVLRLDTIFLKDKDHTIHIANIDIKNTFDFIIFMNFQWNV